MSTGTLAIHCTSNVHSSCNLRMCQCQSRYARACQWALPPCPMLPCLAQVPFLCSVIPSKLNEPQAPSQAAAEWPDLSGPTSPLLKSRSPPVPVGLVRMELPRPAGARFRAVATKCSGSGTQTPVATCRHTHTQPHTAILHRPRSRRPIYTENGQFVFSD